MWSAKNANASYSHVKVFRCIAFAHVNSTPCIFIIYGDEEFWYRLWDPETKKTIKSRDVMFHENQMSKDFEIPHRPSIIVLWIFFQILHHYKLPQMMKRRMMKFQKKMKLQRVSSRRSKTPSIKSYRTIKLWSSSSIRSWWAKDFRKWPITNEVKQILELKLYYAY